MGTTSTSRSLEGPTGVGWQPARTPSPTPQTPLPRPAAPGAPQPLPVPTSLSVPSERASQVTRRPYTPSAAPRHLLRPGRSRGLHGLHLFPNHAPRHLCRHTSPPLPRQRPSSARVDLAPLPGTCSGWSRTRTSWPTHGWHRAEQAGVREGKTKREHRRRVRDRAGAGRGWEAPALLPQPLSAPPRPPCRRPGPGPPVDRKPGRGSPAAG